jgi:hypothetical protein
MKLYSQLLYHLMQVDLENIRKNETDPIRQFERSYETTVFNWMLLKDKIIVHQFESLNEEVDFFKNIKPRFTGEIEYYSLLYHFEIFKPANELELISFLHNEGMRLENFIEKNRSFYQYYKSNRNDYDQIYFVRANNELKEHPRSRYYDMEKGANTSHDHLVASIIALEKYNQYVISKLNNLPSGSK